LPEALALGARFRGHDENVGGSYVHFANIERKPWY
jgi:hypothetical protein